MLPLLLANRGVLAEKLAIASGSLEQLMSLINERCAKHDEYLAAKVAKEHETVADFKHRITRKQLASLGEKLIRKYGLDVSRYPHIYEV